MLYWQHILYSSMLGTSLAVIAYAIDRGRNIRPLILVAFALSVVGAQHLDVDHYYNSIFTLAKCGLMTSETTYKATSECMDLERGVFHHFRTGLLLVGMLIGWASSDRKTAAIVGAAGPIVLYSLIQQVFREALLFYLIGLTLMGFIVRNKSLWLGAIILGLMVGWTQHMYLDKLIHFWFGQVKSL